MPSSPHQPTGTRRGSILPRTTIAPGVALALAAGGYAALAAFVVLHLQARHIHSGVVVLSCFSAVYAGTRLVIGRSRTGTARAGWPPSARSARRPAC